MTNVRKYGFALESDTPVLDESENGVLQLEIQARYLEN